MGWLSAQLFRHSVRRVVGGEGAKMKCVTRQNRYAGAEFLDGHAGLRTPRNCSLPKRFHDHSRCH